MARWDLVVLNEADNVAVALSDLAARDAVLSVGGAIEVLSLPDPVLLGHKVARHRLEVGAPIRKYGAVIGEATAPIAAGAHLHVHNLRSLRARRPAA
jgi:hypothetical protein